MSATVNLYEEPGPLGRRRHRAMAAGFVLALGALVWFVLDKLGEHGQFEAAKWTPFLKAEVWVNTLLPGMWGTVRMAAVSGALALVGGLLLGVGRMSHRRSLRWACTTVVEFGRSVPLLLLIFFAQVGSYALLGFTVLPFEAVVFGLVVYNGAVLAEVVRAGVRSLPVGQSEAAAALGLRDRQTMTLILLPQAMRAMLPAVVMQLVTLLKDTALGFIVSYPELLRSGQLVGTQFANIVPSAIVVAALYITVNLALSALAGRLERRGRRRAAEPAEAESPQESMDQDLELVVR